MKPIRVSRRLQYLQLNSLDPSYWRTLFDMTEDQFAEYTENVLDIVRRRWPSAQQLDRKNYDHVRRLSALLRPMVVATSASFLTTTADLDDMLVENVAFALFLIQVERDHEDANRQADTYREGAGSTRRRRDAARGTGTATWIPNMTHTNQQDQQPIRIDLSSQLHVSLNGMEGVERFAIPQDLGPAHPEISGTNVQDANVQYSLYDILVHIDKSKKPKQDLDE